MWSTLTKLWTHCTQGLESAAHWAYAAILTRPLRKLYFNGPVFMQVGFWAGLEHSEICQQLSTSSQQFWLQHPEECEARIETRFKTFISTVEVALHFLAVLVALRFALRLFLMRLYLYFTVRYTPPPAADPQAVLRQRQLLALLAPDASAGLFLS